MAARIRSRLLLGYLLVLLLGMGLAALLVWRAVANLYQTTQRENLLAQANLIASSLAGQAFPMNDSQPYSQVTNVSPGIHTRFLAEQGGMLVSVPFIEDEIPVPDAEQSAAVSAQELAARPEIQQALGGEGASAVRRVGPDGGRRVIYAAAPVPAPGGAVQGLVYLAAPLPAGGLPGSLMAQLTGAALAAALLAILAGTLLSRQLARPIEITARAASAVSSGDLNQEVSENTGVTELDELGTAFNAMTASLRESEQAKNAFIADVTHELRTPLTVVKGTIETLEDGALDDIEGRGPLLRAMHQETDRLIRLVNDLLVLTRADAGALHLQLQPLDLAELAQSRCARLSLLAAKRGIRLQVQAAETRVQADPDRLAQVWDNLLDNALRYSPQGGTITVSVQRTEHEIHCSVSDQGEGIPAQHLEQLFERFYRVDASRERKSGGAGLGLAIVRALVSAHGGRAWAASQVGKGTTLSFSLPAGSPDGP